MRLAGAVQTLVLLELRENWLMNAIRGSPLAHFPLLRHRSIRCSSVSEMDFHQSVIQWSERLAS